MIRVYLAPLGILDEEMLLSIEECIQRAFGLKTQRQQPLPEPLYAYDAGRRQYDSTRILMDLVRLCPDGSRILGIVEQDLYVPTLSFVFGQAQLDGSAAIVSLARLRQEFYQLPPNAALLHSRARKESIHEMGHSFGLTHCREPFCPMSISTSVRQVDTKSEKFCGSCAILLRERLESAGKPSGIMNDLEGK